AERPDGGGEPARQDERHSTVGHHRGHADQRDDGHRGGHPLDRYLAPQPAPIRDGTAGDPVQEHRQHRGVEQQGARMSKHRDMEGPALRGLGWTTESGAFHIPVFGHPGALLLYTSVLAVLLYRVAGRSVPDWRRLWRQVAVQGVPTTMTIITLVGVATVMAYSGMTFVLARGLTAAVGPLFPLLSPFLGLLGTVI